MTRLTFTCWAIPKKNFPIYPFPYLVMTRLRKNSSQETTFNQKQQKDNYS